MEEMERDNLTRLLQRFEALRGVLGHRATIPHHGVPKLVHSSPFDTFTRYASELRRVRNEVYDPEFPPPPVLPIVDLTDAQIRHGTCTGNTEFGVRQGAWADEWEIWTTREPSARPLDPRDGRDAARAVLGGWLPACPPPGACDPEINEPWDPRPAARRYLASLWGEEVAEDLILDYDPSPEDWRQVWASLPLRAPLDERDGRALLDTPCPECGSPGWCQGQPMQNNEQHEARYAAAGLS